MQKIRKLTNTDLVRYNHANPILLILKNISCEDDIDRYVNKTIINLNCQHKVFL
jgi:hypothetical protein